MKNNILKVAMIGLALSVSSIVNAGVIPYGIQTDMNTSELTNNGWDLNFQSGWGDQGAFDHVIFDGIGLDDYVFIGAVNTGTSNIALGAAIMYSDLLNYTSGNETNEFNGASWYHREDYSLGFAAIGETINLNSADTNGDSGEISKLSWHMHGHHTAGYRVGNYTSNSNGAFEKVVFTTSAKVPEPSTMAVFALAMFGFAARRFKNKNESCNKTLSISLVFYYYDT